MIPEKRRRTATTMNLCHKVAIEELGLYPTRIKKTM